MLLAVALLASLLMLLWCEQASATLLERDWQEPGDSLVTRDTTTNLDWLDLPVSVDLSFAQVEAGEGGFLSDGWRHATGPEVCGLFGELGAVPEPCPGGTLFVLFGDVANHFDFLGVTFDSGFQVILTRGVYDDGLASGAVGLAAISIGGPGAGDISVADEAFGAESRSTITGHFLVRPVPAPAPPLPLLPRSYLVALIGFLILALLGSTRGFSP